MLQNEKKHNDMVKSENIRNSRILDSLRQELFQKNILVNKIQKEGALLQHQFCEILDLLREGSDSVSFSNVGADLTVIENCDNSSILSAVDFSDYESFGQDPSTVVNTVKHEVSIMKQRLRSCFLTFESDLQGLKTENFKLKHDFINLQHSSDEIVRTLKDEVEDLKSHIALLKRKDFANNLELNTLTQSVMERDLKIDQLENMSWGCSEGENCPSRDKGCCRCVNSINVIDSGTSLL